MMFGSRLKRREETRCLVDVFGGCSAGICRLGKEIEFGLLMKVEEFFDILSFYQVHESLPNNPQTHPQGI
jgi:hypothetical protein